jgi:hypothetical protein
MKDGRWRSIRRRLGPIGLSLAAAAITAAGFAAFSLAANDSNGDGSGGPQSAVPLPPPPGGGEIAIAGALRANLSAEDRQKMEDFRQCMEDNGAPAPPRIHRGDSPPKPPSSDEIERIQKAYEACKSKLPEDLQNAGPPQLGVGPPCGPPPGAPGRNQQSQSNDGQNQGESFVVPAPPSRGT